MSYPTQEQVDELKALIEEAFGKRTPEEQLIHAADVAMNRFNVKKGKRPAIERIIMESFKVLSNQPYDRK